MESHQLYSQIKQVTRDHNLKTLEVAHAVEIIRYFREHGAVRKLQKHPCNEHNSHTYTYVCCHRNQNLMISAELAYGHGCVTLVNGLQNGGGRL